MQTKTDVVLRFIFRITVPSCSPIMHPVKLQAIIFSFHNALLHQISVALICHPVNLKLKKKKHLSEEHLQFNLNTLYHNAVLMEK